MPEGKTQNREVYNIKELTNYNKTLDRESSKKEQYKKIRFRIEKFILKKDWLTTAKFKIKQSSKEE